MPTTTDRERLRLEAREWFGANWDPGLTFGAWWARLFEGGWSAPTWPVQAYGRGLSGDLARVVREERERTGAAPGPGGLGVMLAGPTILAHGTPEQKERYLPSLLKGETAWCQLFSEPDAGSDLARLDTRAVPDADGWTVTGQKVWSSGAHASDLGMLLAGTNVDVPKHKGITWFVIEMDQPGIEIRPIREMTGRALFNEVFLDGARVAPDAVVGDLHGGWAVGNTTLGAERSGLGGGSDAAGGVLPGRKGGMLERQAGSLVGGARERSGTAAIMSARNAERLIALARERGSISDPVIRQALAELVTLERVAGYTALRARAAAVPAAAPGRRFRRRSCTCQKWCA